MRSLRLACSLVALILSLFANGSCSPVTPNAGSYNAPKNGLGCMFFDSTITGGAQQQQSSNPLPDFMWTSGGSVVLHASVANDTSLPGMIGYMNTKMRAMDPCTNSNIIVALDTSPASGQTQLQAFILNGANMSIVSGPVNIGPISTRGGSCLLHDCSAVALAWDGQAILTNLAATTFSGFSTGMACMSTTGTGGSAEACQPAYFGSDLSSGANGMANTANNGLLGANFSEVTGGQTCFDAWHNCAALIGGQVQKSIFTVGPRAGEQNFIVARITGDGINGVSFDSQCGAQHITTGFNGFSGAADTTICNWEYVPVDAPQSDYVGTMVITTNPTSTWGFNPPAPFNCTSAITGIAAGATAQASAANGAAAYNGAAGTTAGCPNTRVNAYAVTNASSQFTGTANECSTTGIGCLGFGVEDRDPGGVSASGSTNCTGTSIVCRAFFEIASPSQSVSFIHGLFGGGRTDRQACVNCFVWVFGVQPDTLNCCGGNASNGPNLAVGLMRVEILQPGPGVELCAIDGTNCQDLVLGTSPQTMYKKLGSGGGGTCASNGLSDCTEPGQPAPSSWCTTTPSGHGTGSCDSGSSNPFLIRPCTNTVTNFPANGTPPFEYDWSYQAQNAAIAGPPTFPTASANQDLNFTPGYVWYAWTALDTAGHESAMYVKVSTSTRQSTCGFIVEGADTTHRNVPISLASGASGTMYATLGIPDAGTWTINPNCSLSSHSGLCLVQYSAQSPYTSWTSGTILQSFAGPQNTSSPLSNIFDDEYGMHVYDLYYSGSQTGCTTSNCPSISAQDHYLP